MLEPAELGLLLGGEGGARARALSLFLSLYRAALMVMMAASASDFIVSSFFSRKQAGGALEEEGGEEEEGKLRETHLTRTIWLTSEQPSSNHVR